MSLKLPAGMSAAYENSAASSYLAIEAGDSMQRISWYQLSMLENNRPGNMLPVETRRKNRTVTFYYDITSRLALEFLLKRRKLKRDEFIKLLADLSRPLVDCEGFLLKASGFLLDAAFIYVNPENMEVCLAYLPVRAEENAAEEFKSFVMDLILHKAMIDEAGCDNFLQRIIGFLKRDVFNIKGFQKLLDELVYGHAAPEEASFGFAAGFDEPEVPDRKPAAAADVKKDERRSGWVIAVSMQVLAAVVLLLCRKLIAGIPGNTAATYGAIALVILSADLLLFKRLFFRKAEARAPESGLKGFEKAEAGDIPRTIPAKKPAPAPLTGIKPPGQAKTELLANVRQGFPVLRSTNAADFEEIRINKPEFLIGRLEDQVDHVCRNSAVGKVHALISVRDGVLRLRDLNSVNGTYVNNVRIESNRDVEIRDNDVIAFANSDYILVNK